MAAGVSILASAALISSCSGVRGCAAPELNFPEQIEQAAAADTLTIADISWAEFYADPNLSKLIGQALENNRTLLSGEAGVRRLEELYGVARSNQLPEINYLVAGDQESEDFHGDGRTKSSELDVKLQLSWEIDFWGKLKWARKKAKYDYLATLQGQRALQMTIISQIATAYFHLTALDNELSIVRRTLSTRREGMELAKLRYEGGLTSETVYQQAKVEYATTASLVPNLESRIEETANQLALLIGEFPGTRINRGLVDAELYEPDSASVIISTNLMERRPDIMEAREHLNSAMAQVGISNAQRFPTISINLTGGLENNEFATLLKSPYSLVAGTIAGPLLDMGRRRRNYKAAKAAYDQARYGYEQTVMTAFTEAANAVKNYNESRKTTKLKAELRDAASKYVELAGLQYRAGTISYLDVLDAQRRYFDAQIGVSNAIRDERLAIITLYRALGGGWTPPATPQD